MLKAPIRLIRLWLYPIMCCLMLCFTACEETPSTDNSASETNVQPPPVAQEEDTKTEETAVEPMVAAKGQEGEEMAEQAPPADSDMEASQRPSSQASYDFSKPAHNCKLSKELREVSGLSYDAGRKKLIAVNDERGFVYHLNLEDCKVDEKVDFGKKGDYEGVEKVGNTIYILKSNGNLYPFKQGEKSKVDPIKTALSIDNDVEGLGYDPTQNELILACKGDAQASKQPKIKHAKAFYTFSLSDKKMNKRPKFIIKDKDLETFFKTLPRKKSKKQHDKLWDRLKSFAPSAIARHPVEGDYYILSTVGKLLIVADGNGGVRSVEFLNDKLFTQPEGICFAPDATLYVSNEGRSHSASILRFDYQQ